MSEKERNILTERHKINVIEGQLIQDRDQFVPYWTDLSDYVLPRRSRFTITDVNKGDRRNLKIYDISPSLAVRTISSGMMTGITSPARSWFNLGASSKELRKSKAVQLYFEEVSDNMRDIFLRSNLYNVLPVTYSDLSVFSNGCVYMEQDIEDVVNFQVFPIGSYAIGNDKKGRVRTFFREFQMSVRQVVEKFGKTNKLNPDFIDWTNISQQVRDSWEAHNYYTMVDVAHIILPNDDYNEKKKESKFKKFKSLYYEKGVNNTNNTVSQSNSGGKFLSWKGYDYFPIMCVRWQVNGEDVWGTDGPAMLAIGDIKQLQFGEKRIAMALDQKVNPSMIGPTSLRETRTSTLPGQTTYADEREGTKGYRRLFEVDFDIREMEAKQEQVRGRISRAFYEDLFLMLANSTRRQITAREVEERHEEKLLALGPVLERINQDLLDPLITNTFMIMNEMGLLPDPPEELVDELNQVDYKVEYISVMAQAQKLAGIGGIERTVGFIGQVAQIDPTAAQKLDVDETIEVYADKVGLPKGVLRSKDEMKEMREKQAQAQQDEQDSIDNGDVINSAKTLSETKMNEDSALQALLGGGVESEI